MEFDVENLRGRRVTDRASRTSVGDLWERQAWSNPDAIALVGEAGAYESAGHSRLSYGQADALANKVAHALAAAGLQDGDIAALVCGNSVEALVVKIGMAKAGVVAAPMNPAWPADVTAEVLQRIGAKALVSDAEYVPRLQRVLASVDVPLLTAIGVGGVAADGVPGFAEFTQGMPDTEPATVVCGDDIWQLLFTSGTSAAPKAAMLSHHNTYYAALAWSSTFTLGLAHERDAVICSFLPVVFHTADVLMYAAWLVGGSVVIGRTFDPVQMVSTIGQHRVTMLWAGMPQAVDAVANAIKADPGLDVSSLGSVTYGWAPLPEETYDRLQRAVGHPVRVQSIIGMTEVVVAHRFWLDEYEDLYRRTTPRDNYVGLPSPMLAARLVDVTTGDVLPMEPGGLGEVVYRSPALTAGYYLDEVATREAMKSGWFHTGDLFGYGEANQRMMVDRLKDVIKSGGENVSSIRVEAVLRRHEHVAQAAVIAVGHPRWGEAVTAVVEAVPGADPDPQEIIEFCKQHLAGYEVPKAVVIVETLPTSVGGKLQKHVIRDSINTSEIYD